MISHYKNVGYNINVLQQTACLVVSPITVGNLAFLFNCTPVGRTSDSMKVLMMRWFGPDALAVVRPNRIYLLDFFSSGIQLYVLLNTRIVALSPFHILIYMFWEICMEKLGVFRANQTSMCLDPHLN